MNGISILIKEVPAGSLTPAKTQGGDAVHEPGPGFSPPIKSANALLLDFQAQNCEQHISVVYKPPTPSLW